MGVVLDQRRPERVLERLAILDRDMLHRFHCIEVLRQADRKASIPEFDDKAVQEFQHGLVVDRKLFSGLRNVGLVFQQDVERFLGSLLIDRVDVENHQGAGPVEGLRNAGGLFEVELTNRPHDARDLIGQRLCDIGYFCQHDFTLTVELG